MQTQNPDSAKKASTSLLKLAMMKHLLDSIKILVSTDRRWIFCDGILLDVACFPLFRFFLWYFVSRVRQRQLLGACCLFTPTRPKGGGDEAAVGWHAKWNVYTHSACLNSSVWDLSCREVGDCSTPLLITMLLLPLCSLCCSSLVLHLLDFLISFSFVQLPHNERVASILT